MRDFPLLSRAEDEPEVAYVLRVAQLVREAMATGGTHLLVPRALADWLGDHPQLAEYFAEHHELVEASAETGIVFALYPRAPMAFTDRG